MLAGRPFPHINEGAQGYFLRLANVNGFVSIPEMFAALGLKTKSSLIKQDMEGLLKHCRALGPAMKGRKAEEILKGLNTHAPQTLIFDSFRLIQDIRVEQPRICTSCIVEETGIDWHWSLLPVHQCIKHNTALIERCPNCSTKLRWHFELFTHCHSCNCKWEDIGCTEEEIGPLQRELYAIEDYCPQDLLDKVNDVVLATMVSARPFDTFYQSIQGVPSKCHELIPITKQAYGLLCNPEIRRSWKAAVTSERSNLKIISEKAVLAPVRFFDLMTKLDWPDLYTCVTSPQTWKEHVEFVRPKRTKSIQQTDLKYQCHKREFIKSLGMSFQSTCFSSQSISQKAFINRAFSRDELFDIRKLIRR